MTEYEKELKLREVYVGDKFIFQGGIYNTVRTQEKYSCKGCSFQLPPRNCYRLPDCSINDVIYIKEVNGD